MTASTLFGDALMFTKQDKPSISLAVVEDDHTLKHSYGLVAQTTEDKSVEFLVCEVGVGSAAGTNKVYLGSTASSSDEEDATIHFNGETTFSSTTIEADSATGGALTISNNDDQTSAELVLITGTAGQTAFKVETGNIDLNTGTTRVNSITDGTATLTGGNITNAGSITATTLTDGTATINSGDITCNTLETTSSSTSSDRSIKENVKEHDLEATHSLVMKLKGVDYNLIADDSKAKNSGFIAQDVEEVLPQFVRTNSKGLKSVNYSQMTSVLLSAIQHQDALIQKLTTRIEALEST